MNRVRGLTVFCCVMVVFGLIVGAGCEKPAPSTTGPQAVSPEESFKSIVATIRRGLEISSGGVFSGGAPNRSGGFTALSINNQVSDEYFAPTQEGEPHRGKITIESQSQVTIQLAPASGEGRGERSDGDNTGDATGVENDAFDPASSSRSNRRITKAPSSDVPLARPASVTANYEMIHRNGRWELVTPIDRKSDQAAFEAFDYALKTQL